MIDTLLQNVVGENAGEWIQTLTGKLGFSSDQATAFLPAMTQKITELFNGGGLDLSNGFDLSSLLGKLNPSEIGEAAGVSAEQASSGLQSLLPSLGNAMQEKAGGADGLLSMLGGEGGGLGDTLGKLGDLF